MKKHFLFLCSFYISCLPLNTKWTFQFSTELHGGKRSIFSKARGHKDPWATSPLPPEEVAVEVVLEPCCAAMQAALHFHPSVLADSGPRGSQSPGDSIRAFTDGAAKSRPDLI